MKASKEARRATELKAKKGIYKSDEEYRPVIVMNHNQFNALIEGYDFDLTPLGEIKFKK